LYQEVQRFAFIDNGAPQPFYQSASGRSPEAWRDAGCRRLATEVAYPGHEQRLDAKRIARGDNPLRSSQNEGEHAIQLGYPTRFVRAKQVQDGFAVAFGLESAFTEDRAQICVIVDLAVGDEDVFSTVNRLAAVFGTYNRQSAVSHYGGHVGRLAHVHFVRPAMGDLADHPTGKFLIVNIPEADKAAHNHLVRIAFSQKGDRLF